MKKGKVQNFDVALYKDGGRPGEFIPRVAIYGEGFPFSEFFVNEHVFLLRSKILGQPYLYRLISSPSFLHQLIATGSSKAAQPGLNQEEVINSSFIFPNKSIIDCFNKLIEPILNRQFLLGRENLDLCELRDTLLPKVISGKLKISDLKKTVNEVSV